MDVGSFSPTRLILLGWTNLMANIDIDCEGVPIDSDSYDSSYCHAYALNCIDF